MAETKRKKLAVLGAGPKAMAIVAKALVLGQHEFDVPEIAIIDRSKKLASHWSGDAGYTDGRQPLGTPPEKDVGFPYDSRCWFRDNHDFNAVINSAMLQYSWHRHLIVRPAAAAGITPAGSYGDWVDRSRYSPMHRDWCRYLHWVGDEARLAYTYIAGELMIIDINLTTRQWQLTVGADLHLFDGLVLSGPGPSRKLDATVPNSPRILDGATFWEKANQLRWEAVKNAKTAITVAVIGNGETAAGIVCYLLKVLPESCTVKLLGGPIYSRGEGFHENRVYTDPEIDQWPLLTDERRKEFLRRTDRGVFSQTTIDHLRRPTTNFTWMPGRVESLVPTRDSVKVVFDKKENRPEEVFDYVVEAMGFNTLWFRARMTPAAGTYVDGIISKPWSRQPAHQRDYTAAIDSHVEFDLALGKSFPKLHLPMFAAHRQGPGFPNLSCLGRVADRILFPYVENVQSRQVTLESEGYTFVKL